MNTSTCLWGIFIWWNFNNKSNNKLLDTLKTIELAKRMLFSLFLAYNKLLKAILCHTNTTLGLIFYSIATVKSINPLTPNPTKWLNTIKQFAGKNRQIVWVNHFVGLVLKRLKIINPFLHSIAFHIGTPHLICTVNQIAGFYMKCNTRLKWM